MFGPAIEGLEGELQKAAELKALHKSTLLKLASQRASQRVYPTFDINPQVVKDFLDQALISENGLPSNGLIFESSRESRSIADDSTEAGGPAGGTKERSTSFAQALLSKLNVANESPIASPVPTRNHHSRAISSISSMLSESQGPSRGPSPAKSEPGARSGASPNGFLPSRNGGAEGLPVHDGATPDRIRPLLSYARSVMQSRCQTDPGSLVVLSDDKDLCGAAGESNVPTRGISEIRQISAVNKAAEKRHNHDRDTVGEVDALKDPLSLHKTMTESSGAVPLGAKNVIMKEDSATEDQELSRPEIFPRGKQIVLDDTVVKKENQAVPVGHTDVGKSEAALSEAIPAEAMGDVVTGNTNGTLGTLDGVQEKEDSPPTSDITASAEKTSPLSGPAQILEKKVPRPQELSHEASSKPTASNNKAGPNIPPPGDSDSSDEEVVVFNPRSKRLSQTKASLEPPKTPRAPQLSKVPKKHEAPPSNGGPALIDPDAFGRSFARKPSGVALNAGRALAARSPRGSPRHSPHRSIATPEPADVDFVLKSGSPRGAARGRGKLWVP